MLRVGRSELGDRGPDERCEPGVAAGEWDPPAEPRARQIDDMIDDPAQPPGERYDARDGNGGIAGGSEQLGADHDRTERCT
jgi:hypothetical protein